MGIELTDAVRLAWIGPSKSYTTSNGEHTSNDSVDIVGCISTPGRVHHAFTGTGAINAGSLSCIPGTVVNKCIYGENSDGLRLGHPAGFMHVKAHCEFDRVWKINRAGFVRTARCLMMGEVYIP